MCDEVFNRGPAPDFAAIFLNQSYIPKLAARDGSRYTSTVYAPKGSGLLGIAWADIDAKYRALLPQAGLSHGAIEASLEIIHDFRRLTRVSAVIDRLRAA